MVQTEDHELIDWAMLVNDKLERKITDPKFDAGAAMKELCLAFFKAKQACLRVYCRSVY